MTTILMMLGATVFSAFALKFFGATVLIVGTGFATFAALSLDQTVIPVLLAVLSSGFIFGLFKIMPERRSILIQASENAVKVVNDAIGTLQKELAEARREIARLEGELKTARIDREKTDAEIQTLRLKVTHLEGQLDMYERIRGATERPGYPERRSTDRKPPRYDDG